MKISSFKNSKNSKGSNKRASRKNIKKTSNKKVKKSSKSNNKIGKKSEKLKIKVKSKSLSKNKKKRLSKKSKVSKDKRSVKKIKETGRKKKQKKTASSANGKLLKTVSIEAMKESTAKNKKVDTKNVSSDSFLELDLNLLPSADQAANEAIAIISPLKRKRGRPRKNEPSTRAVAAVDLSESLNDTNTDELLADFFKENHGIGSLKDGLKIPLPPEKLDEILLKMMSIVDKFDNVKIPYNRFLLQNSEKINSEVNSEDGASINLNVGIFPSQFVDMLDRDVYRSIAESFIDSLSEKIDPSKITPGNKVYIAKWTNRVAIWRFFERYVVPVANKYQEEVGDYLQYHSRKISEFSDHKVMVFHRNPFHQYGHAFEVVMKAWTPCIKKVIKIFTTNTRGGVNLQEDFMSISYMAFLHALEKQAMAILANAKVAQGIPFPKRLEYAVRKSIYSDLPDLTGPVRVPIESKQRKTMPVEVSLDAWYDDSDY